MSETQTEVRNLKQLLQYQEKSVVSRMLVKNPAGSVTLFAFDSGEGLSEHTAPFDALVQGVEGQAVLGIPAAGLDHQRRRIHAFQRAARRAVHHPVHRLAGALTLFAVDAGRVHQLQLATWKGGDAEQAVPGGLRPVGSDADLGAHQGVGQGGLAGVGPTHEAREP